MRLVEVEQVSVGVSRLQVIAVPADI